MHPQQTQISHGPIYPNSCPHNWRCPPFVDDIKNNGFLQVTPTSSHSTPCTFSGGSTAASALIYGHPGILDSIENNDGYRCQSIIDNNIMIIKPIIMGVYPCVSISLWMDWWPSTFISLWENDPCLGLHGDSGPGIICTFLYFEHDSTTLMLCKIKMRLNVIPVT